MPLSEYEQRVLEQMERALTSDDPRLASALQAPKRRSGIRYLVGGAAVVGGLLLLILGVSLPMMWLGAIGFIAMFAGVIFVIQSPQRQKLGVVEPSGKVRQPAKPAKRTFMSRLEERWDRRRHHDG